MLFPVNAPNQITTTPNHCSLISGCATNWEQDFRSFGYGIFEFLGTGFSKFWVRGFRSFGYRIFEVLRTPKSGPKLQKTNIFATFRAKLRTTFRAKLVRRSRMLPKPIFESQNGAWQHRVHRPKCFYTLLKHCILRTGPNPATRENKSLKIVVPAVFKSRTLFRTLD